MAVLHILIFLPLNVGLLSGESCQHFGIQVLANDTKSAFPVIASNGGRLPCMTPAFTCSLMTAVKVDQTKTQLVCSWQKQEFYIVNRQLYHQHIHYMA